MSLANRARRVHPVSVARLRVLFAGLLILFGSGCTLFQPTEKATADWFSIQVPLAAWDVETTGPDPVRLGVIEHRSLTGCRVTLVTRDPFYLAGHPTGWEGMWEPLPMSPLRVVRVTVRDETNTPRLIYYDVYDGTGGRDSYRLAYFQVEWEENVEQCLEAFEELLMDVDPGRFPELPVAQG